LSSRAHHTDYNEATTALCERILVTLLGDLGPWRERIYLAGGLAPRFLVGQLLEERLRDAEQDGPNAYALFLAEPDDEDDRARLRQEAVAAVRAFLAGFRGVAAGLE
jgi:hypothetical protein